MQLELQRRTLWKLIRLEMIRSRTRDTRRLRIRSQLQLKIKGRLKVEGIRKGRSLMVQRYFRKSHLTRKIVLNVVRKAILGEIVPRLTTRMIRRRST